MTPGACTAPSWRWTTPCAAGRAPESCWLAVAGVAIVGVFDYLTGLEMSVSVFYLAPVSLAAWYGGRRDGQFIALIASPVWSGVDLLAGYPLGHPVLLVWDTLVHFVFLAFSAMLLEALRSRLAERAAPRPPGSLDRSPEPAGVPGAPGVQPGAVGAG